MQQTSGAGPTAGSWFTKPISFAILEDYDKGESLGEMAKDFALFKELGVTFGSVGQAAGWSRTVWTAEAPGGFTRCSLPIAATSPITVTTGDTRPSRSAASAIVPRVARVTR